VQDQNRIVTATHAHLFLDIHRYSRMLEERGEGGILKILRPYERIVRAALPRKSAEVDHYGDGFHLVFPTASQAVFTAVAIANALERHNARHPEVPLPVKLAIEAGQSLRRNGSYVGNAVAVAAHLVGLAEPGQILVADGAAGLLRTNKATPLRDLGIWKIRGAEGVHVYEARTPDPKADGTTRPRRLLATALHTDIVDSTATARARRGTDGWKDMFEQHHAIIRQELRRHGGVEVDTAGDGFFATFDMPSQAIDSALAMRDRIRTEVGIEIRVGVHTGECEVIAGKVGGMAVVIGGRIRDGAGAGDVLVSRTVKDLLLGSPYAFTARGPRALKGVPGEWEIYAVEPASAEA
jgi:class 3 adenylate cyclase